MGELQGGAQRRIKCTNRHAMLEVLDRTLPRILVPQIGELIALLLCAQQLRASLEAALRQAAAAGGAQTKSLACVLENTWRSTVGVACYGVLVTPFREIAGGVYLWVHDDDDVIGIGYANADADLAPLEAMVKSAR